MHARMHEIFAGVLKRPRRSPRAGVTKPDTRTQAIDSVRHAVATALPPGSAVLVVSRGDPELVRLPERTGRHFPSTPDGRYAGFHPADSRAALEALQRQMSDAQFLLFPASSFWWLDYYREFAEVLNTRYKRVWSDGDCVISCEGKGGCCNAPCCETAILSSEANAIAAYNRDHCPKNPQCPTVGGCQMDNIVSAKCQAGACVAVKTPRPPTFGIACKTTDDCTVINMDPCDKCGCAQTPVQKSEEQRAKAYAATIICDQKVPDNRQCGECMPARVECVHEGCVAK